MSADILPLPEPVRGAPSNSRFPRQAQDWYVEPAWASSLLAEAEGIGNCVVWDPACGCGTIADVMRARGCTVWATDLCDRGYAHFSGCHDFLRPDLPAIWRAHWIVTNPPFIHAEAFLRAALHRAENVAIFVPLSWLASRQRYGLFAEEGCIAQVWVHSERPSCLPGEMIRAGVKAGGGKENYCWVVARRDACGPPTLGWLSRGRRPVGGEGEE